MDMRERAIEAVAKIEMDREGVPYSRTQEEYYDDAAETVDAVLEALRDPPMEVLQAGYEAMFTDKWDGTQAPMMGAGYDAMINAARSPVGKE